MANHSKKWDANLTGYVLIQGDKVAGLLGDPISFSNSGKRLTAKVREKLIDTHLPLVRQIADRVHRHRIEFDSLAQSDVVGLREAAPRY